MKTTTKILAAALIASSFGTSVYAQGTHSHGDHGMKPGSASMGDMQKMMADMTPAESDAPSTKDFKQADMAMMHNMSVAYTGTPDADFRTHMIPHHQGAIDMAKVALKHAKNPETIAMAQKIIDDQEKEIADMQAWLKKSGHSDAVRANTVSGTGKSDK